MKRFFLMFFAVLIVLATVPQASFAQVTPPGAGKSTNQDGTIIIKGVVKSISGSTWVVGDTPIEVGPGTTVSGNPSVGSAVTITVRRGADNRLVATSVVVIIINVGAPQATASATSVATASSTAPATASATSSATSPATQDPGVRFVTIIIEGPVERVDVNINIVVVYGMKIKLRGDDPIKMKIKHGDWIRVKGHFDRDNDDFDRNNDRNEIIVIVIIIIIIDTPPIIVVVPSGGSGGDDDGMGMGMGDDDDD
jgi:hypothetical protein